MGFNCFHFFCYIYWTFLKISPCVCNFRAFFNRQRFTSCCSSYLSISQMLCAPGTSLQPKLCLGPFAAGADPVSVHLQCPPASCVSVCSVCSCSLLGPVLSTFHFLRTLHNSSSLTPKRWTDILFSWEKWGHLLRAPSILLFQTSQHFYLEEFSVQIISALWFSDPKLELCLMGSCKNH